MSLGCSMFAASVLASRLESRAAVFADMTLSVLLFVLFPFFQQGRRGARPGAEARGARRRRPPAAALGVAHASAGADGAARLASTPVALCVAAVLFVALACLVFAGAHDALHEAVVRLAEASFRAEALAARRLRLLVALRLESGSEGTHTEARAGARGERRRGRDNYCASCKVLLIIELELHSYAPRPAPWGTPTRRSARRWTPPSSIPASPNRSTGASFDGVAEVRLRGEDGGGDLRLELLVAISGIATATACSKFRLRRASTFGVAHVRQ